jgi:hypothetical protein
MRRLKVDLHDMGNFIRVRLMRDPRNPSRVKVYDSIEPILVA